MWNSIPDYVILTYYLVEHDLLLLQDFDKIVEQEKELLRQKIEQEKLEKEECPIKHG